MITIMIILIVIIIIISIIDGRDVDGHKRGVKNGARAIPGLLMILVRII